MVVLAGHESIQAPSTDNKGPLTCGYAHSVRREARSFLARGRGFETLAALAPQPPGVPARHAHRPVVRTSTGGGDGCRAAPWFRDARCARSSTTGVARDSLLNHRGSALLLNHQGRGEVQAREDHRRQVPVILRGLHPRSSRLPGDHAAVHHAISDHPGVVGLMQHAAVVPHDDVAGKTRSVSRTFSSARRVCRKQERHGVPPRVAR